MKKRIFALCLAFALALPLAACGSSSADDKATVSSAPIADESVEPVEDGSTDPVEDESTAAEDEDGATSAETSAVAADEPEYDELQTLFLSVEDGLTEESLLDAIEENSLYYRDEEGDESHYYKVAYTEGVAKLSHADEGDHFEISFYPSDGTVKYAHYFEESLFVSAYYKYSKLDFDYAYTDYSSTPNLRADGSKSGTTSMNYYKADSVKEALDSALALGGE